MPLCYCCTCSIAAARTSSRFTRRELTLPFAPMRAVRPARGGESESIEKCVCSVVGFPYILHGTLCELQHLGINSNLHEDSGGRSNLYFAVIEQCCRCLDTEKPHPPLPRHKEPPSLLWKLLPCRISYLGSLFIFSRAHDVSSTLPIAL